MGLPLDAAQHAVTQVGHTATTVGDTGSITAVLFRRRRIFSLVFGLILLPVVAAAFLWPPIYYASGSVIIGNMEPGSGLNGGLGNWLEKFGDPADLESQVFIAKSPRMLRLTLEHPGTVAAIQEDCRHRVRYRLGRLDCQRLKPSSEEALNYLRQHSDVSAVPHSRIILISYHSTLPRAAFILANALMITYLEDQRAENASIRELASAWLLEAGKKADTGAAEGKLAAGGSTLNQIYKNFYDKAADLERERRSLVNPAHLVNFAELPKEPSFPKPLLMIMVGTGLATGVAALVALRADATDETVRRTRDLELLTGEPVLAAFPRIASSTIRKSIRRQLTSALRSFGIQPVWAVSSGTGRASWETPSVSDEAHAFCERLLLDTAEQERGLIILIASGMPGEGKTFTTMAVARAAARSGRKALVINCDLRRATTASPGSYYEDKGLAEILLGEIKPQEAAIQTCVPGLEIIPAGSTRTDTVMLKERMSDLISWAGKYDLVLIDGPSGLLNDTGIIARYAEGVVWCVGWGHTHLADLRTDLAHLHNRKIRLLGLALTMVDHREFRYYQRKL